jgi:hypothetical protein
MYTSFYSEMVALLTKAAGAAGVADTTGAAGVADGLPLDEVFGTQSDLTIADFFDQLFFETNLERSAVIRDAHIARTYGYQLMNGTRFGHRDYYLSIAFAMHLNLWATESMLALAGCGGLHPLVRRDRAIIQALLSGYDSYQLHDHLVASGLAPLNTRAAA